MTPPTSYTEATLKTFMWTELQDVADAVGLDQTTMLDEAVNDTLIEYGVSVITDATDIKKLRALAKYFAWKLAVSQVSADYAFSEASASYQRNQALEGLLKRLAIAEREALPYLTSYAVGTVLTEYPEDPYNTYTYIDLGV